MTAASRGTFMNSHGVGGVGNGRSVQTFRWVYLTMPSVGQMRQPRPTPQPGPAAFERANPPFRSMFTDIHIVCKWAPYIGLAIYGGGICCLVDFLVTLTVALIVLPGMTWGVIWTGANNYGRRINDSGDTQSGYTAQRSVLFL